MTRLASGTAIVAISLMMLAGCGADDAEDPGTVSAEITCTAQDSLLATVYLTEGDVAGASEWCPCGSEGCFVEFGGLGYGDYVLGISVPDSVYARTEGTEGFVRTLGYYSQGGIDEVADTITLSGEQPSASIVLDIQAGPMQDAAQADTLDGVSSP